MRARPRIDWRRPELADLPSSTRVLDAVAALGEASPASIVDLLATNGFEATPRSVQCSLQRLRRVGRVRRIGYGKWVLA